MLHPLFANILATQAQAAVATSNTLALDEYRRLLKAHDWSFGFSEDYSVFRRGQAERMKLIELRAKLDPDGEIWNQFAQFG